MNKRKVFQLLVAGGVCSVLLTQMASRSASPVSVNALSTMSIDISDESDSAVNAYYSGVEGLQGEALKSALHNIIDDHSTLSYDDDVDAVKITDRDWTLSPMTSTELAAWTPSNDLGSGDPYLNLMYGANYNGTANAVKWSEDHTTIWNKEHIWAKSHGDFDTIAPAGTDLHHLRAADQGINLLHSNYDYANVTSSITIGIDERGFETSAKRGYSAESPSTYVFEASDEDKGDIARALFYMPTRYYHWISLYDPKLELVDVSSYTVEALASTPDSPGKMAFLQTLLAWHEADPVSDFEIHRNNLIFNNFQHNRNPFIDHPEWVDMIYDASYSGTGATLADGSACTIGSCSTSPEPTVTLTGISIAAPATTLEFTQGDAFSSEGLSILATYSDLTTAYVSGYTLSPSDGTILTTVGNQTVTVTYSESGISKTASYSITVLESGDPTPGYSTELFISEYIEGSSYNKALEIYNGTGISVDLSAYTLKLFSNGGTTASASVTLSGSLAHGLTYVIYNSLAASNFIPATNAIASGVANFNGDDAVGLFKNDTLIDVFGTIGNDPGTAWTGTDANGVATSSLDHTLLRVPTTISPSTTFGFGVWLSYPIDTSMYLGSFEAEIVTPTEPTLESISLTGLPITSYDVGDIFSTVGLEVTATYSDSTNQIVTPSSITIDGVTAMSGSTILTTSGSKIVAVNYEENSVLRTATYSITVAELVTLASISITTMPSTLTYTVNDVFSSDGLVVKATYSDASVMTITGYTLTLNGNEVISGTTLLTTVGNFTILVSYSEDGVQKTTSFGITVEAALPTHPITTDLFISEYIEGSSNNKALEIYNGTGIAVNLSSYTLSLFVNGARKPTTSFTLSGVLEDGQVFVVYNSLATSAFIPATNSIASAVCTFNGDDAIGLYKTGVLIDLIGVIGKDPGTAWTGIDANGVSASTLDMTLVRIASQISPSAKFTWNQWKGYPIDTSIYLGQF